MVGWSYWPPLPAPHIITVQAAAGEMMTTLARPAAQHHRRSDITGGRSGKLANHDLVSPNQTILAQFAAATQNIFAVLAFVADVIIEWPRAEHCWRASFTVLFVCGGFQVSNCPTLCPLIKR